MPMPPRKTVLVAGASGLVGAAAARHFAAEPGTAVLALARRPVAPAGARAVPLDLRDPAAVAAAAPGFASVTHLVFAALHEQPELTAGWRDPAQIDTNAAMLRHLLDALDTAAPALRHVTLLQGTKAYGVHVGPFAIPAREDRSERRDIPNFYWAQQDLLTDRQRGRSWHWTILRPVLIVGSAIGGAMNLIPPLGVYAALLGERGEAFHYPGGAPRVAQAVDADLLARAIGWAGETAAARDQAFNVTNGDVFVWEHIWPAVAAAFGMAPGEARPCALARFLPEHEPAWNAIAARHGLTAPGLADFIGLSAQYADYTWRHGRTDPGPPSIVSTVKIRQAGFHDVMDTETMFARHIAAARAARLLPPLRA